MQGAVGLLYLRLTANIKESFSEKMGKSVKINVLSLWSRFFGPPCTAEPARSAPTHSGVHKGGRTAADISTNEVEFSYYQPSTDSSGPSTCNSLPKRLLRDPSYTESVLGRLLKTFFFQSTNICSAMEALARMRYKPTQGKVTSQNLWPRYDRHFVVITWHNVWS